MIPYRGVVDARGDLQRFKLENYHGIISLKKYIPPL